jgi:hypothetical protein
MQKNLNRLARGMLVVCFCVFSFSSYSQPQPAAATNRGTGNIYTNWIKLALVGKNQAEIEFFFRNEREAAIDQVKERIRHAVLENLRRAGIKRLIAESSDADDLNVIIKKIIIEIRYAGLELDRDLRLSIKEEFNIALETL